MFYTVKEKIDYIFEEGYRSKYDDSQIAWERLRSEEPILFKKVEDGKLVGQLMAIPDKMGVYFERIPVEDDYCRFHESPIK